MTFRLVSQTVADLLASYLSPERSAPVIAQVQGGLAHDGQRSGMGQVPKVLEARQRIEASFEMRRQGLEGDNVLIGIGRRIDAVAPAPEYADAFREVQVGFGIEVGRHGAGLPVTSTKLGEPTQELLCACR